MKRIIFAVCLVLGISSLAYANHFCCSGSKEDCCAQKGKLYCENDNTCRTRCKCETDECCGCINPEGVCCLWCPTAEVCAYKGLCQRIVDGCYTCDTCDPVCPSPKCLNEEGICCDSCPRTCPDGQCLINVDGCYECGECGDDDDDDDGDECDPPCDEDNCEKCKNGVCVSKCDKDDCEACVDGKCKD